MYNYVSPSFKARAFNCPYCGAYSEMQWVLLYTHISSMHSMDLYQAQCSHCFKSSCWQGTTLDAAMEHTEGVLVMPDNAAGPLPHPDMPEVVAGDYLEARSIVGRSPRGAAALLRLVIQKLCEELGEISGNINTDIGNLVKKGLPVEIQQAMDVVRVVGNNAVHPGELSDSDIADVATTLFELINAVVEDRIARPKKLSALFSRLPQGARDAIDKRDTPKTT